MHRLRKNGLKVQHSILGHLKPVLTKLLAECKDVTRIIPGEICVTRGVGQGKTVGIRITVPLQTAEKGTGFKAIALADGSRQEIFVSTALPKARLEEAFTAAGASVTSTADSCDDRHNPDEGIAAASPSADTRR